MAADGLIISVAFATTYVIRFDGVPNWLAIKQCLLWLPYIVAGRIGVNLALGIYRSIWRYASLSEAVTLARALTVVTAVLLGLRIFYPQTGVLGNRLRIPLGVIVLEYVLSLLLLVGARLARRILYEKSAVLAAPPSEQARRTLLYGAGRAGALLVKDIRHRSDIEIVGFIDDDPRKRNARVAGRPVLGNGDQLESIACKYLINQVVISVAAPGREFIARVVSNCKRLRVPVKIIPSLQDVFLRSSLSQLQEIRIEDLLGRDGVNMKSHEPMLRGMYEGKRLLITGAGGSIGSELVRQVLLFDPEAVCILDKDENSVYELDQDLRTRFPEATIEPCIADLRSQSRLRSIFRSFRPHIVFHAAAHKHVPLMEINPGEAILNNVRGTHNLLRASTGQVERFIYISSDKAVNPTNVMGATKCLGELLVRAYSRQFLLRAVCVRFGNVLGSRGSVVPLFQKQIARGGPVTITHPEMVRYFMTIPEAVHLVMCAGTFGGLGEIFVLDMGTPRKIVDLAHDLITLAGLRPGRDIEIQFTGPRPGEKMYEELANPDESLRKTEISKLMMIDSAPIEAAAVLRLVDRLIVAARSGDEQSIYRVLMNCDIGFSPREFSHENSRSRIAAVGF
jgi:FlaA1/EpsC-like NDP-sugar epimerase